MTDIIIIDGQDVPHPEDLAMLQALYSRSPQSVTLHLNKVREAGSGRFIEKYLVGYGHKSIGDCGTTTIFVENVSMLCAKAIQDNPLYNGQEASTRYLDFGGRDIIDPVATNDSKAILANWINLYKDVLAELIPHFESRFPIEEGQKKSVWRKAVKARAFDVARGFLPAGSTTFVAWHTNLRQAYDHLCLMRHNPLSEVRNVAEGIHEELMKRYPSSFSHKRYEASEAYLAQSAARFAFTEDTGALIPEHGFHYDASRLRLSALAQHRDLLESRPPKTELHQRMRQYGSIDYRFMLDFGGYRDLQRHRSCVQEMPLLTTKWGILPWYIEQLPENIQNLVQTVAQDQERLISKLPCSPEEKQNYIAMGYASPIKINCSLPSAVYIAELRSGTTVHPTVRKPAQQIGEMLLDTVPGIAMHHDMSDGVWDIKRGSQDIVKKS